MPDSSMKGLEIWFGRVASQRTPLCVEVACLPHVYVCFHQVLRFCRPKVMQIGYFANLGKLPK